MHVLEYIGTTNGSARLQAGARIAITCVGVVFVGELRASQDASGARLVALGDSTVTSGRYGHCKLSIVDGQVVLYDCGSDNGTWIVHGDTFQRVGSIASPTTIAAGTEIAIGRSRFRVLDIPD